MPTFLKILSRSRGKFLLPYCSFGNVDGWSTLIPIISNCTWARLIYKRWSAASFVAHRTLGLNCILKISENTLSTWNYFGDKGSLRSRTLVTTLTFPAGQFFKILNIWLILIIALWRFSLFRSTAIWWSRITWVVTIISWDPLLWFNLTSKIAISIFHHLMGRITICCWSRLLNAFWLSLRLRHLAKYHVGRSLIVVNIRLYVTHWELFIHFRITGAWHFQINL